jgi:ATP-dependent RNA helicase RhlE
LSVTFESLGLSAALTRAVTEQGYTIPTPIQAQAIPAILAGRDVLAGAQTGTGKTAGFTLPMLQRLATRANGSASPARHPIRALVLTPTRELAAQVEQSVRTYGQHTSLRSTVVYGGMGMRLQIDALRRGVDILVATPGRLLDHIGQRTVDLSRVEILVLDEADRMLDMGFIHDIRRVIGLLPATRQNLLFSATFSAEIRRLADGLLKSAESIQVARHSTEAELVAQRAYPVAQAHKRRLLAHLIRAGGWSQVLVFARTKHGANRLAEQLQRDGVDSTAIHGDKSQPQRQQALAKFKQGAVRVLVATDIAARGIDIDALPHVVNFDLPHVAEDYIHRIGRTGRAGKLGEAISLVSPEERPLMTAIEKMLGRRIERAPTPGIELIADAATVSAPARPAPPTHAHPGTPSIANRGHKPRHNKHQDRGHENGPRAEHKQTAKPRSEEHQRTPDAFARRNKRFPNPRMPSAALLGGK